MAGSFNHIVAEDGTFTIDLIENMGDAWEALEECHQIIAFLLPFAAVGFVPKTTAPGMLAEALHHLNYPKSHTPIEMAIERRLSR